MAETAFKWLDDEKNFNKRADVKAGIDALIGVPEGRLDPQEMIDAIVEVLSSDGGKFRNVVPLAVEQMLKDAQEAAWDATV